MCIFPTQAQHFICSDFSCMWPSFMGYHMVQLHPSLKWGMKLFLRGSWRVRYYIEQTNKIIKRLGPRHFLVPFNIQLYAWWWQIDWHIFLMVFRIHVLKTCRACPRDCDWGPMWKQFVGFSLHPSYERCMEALELICPQTHLNLFMTPSNTHTSEFVLLLSWP